MLAAAMFSLMWRVSAMTIPALENIRYGGGLHPLDVLLLKDMLELMWVFPLVATILHAASFLFSKLNAPASIAVTALSSAALLAFVLLCALIHISLWRG